VTIIALLSLCAVFPSTLHRHYITTRFLYACYVSTLQSSTLNISHSQPPVKWPLPARLIISVSGFYQAFSADKSRWAPRNNNIVWIRAMDVLSKGVWTRSTDGSHLPTVTMQHCHDALKSAIKWITAQEQQTVYVWRPVSISIHLTVWTGVSFCYASVTENTTG